ncbi:sulfate reduction electron transfer complex DsrMKJOP subunit DsrJ [Moorella sulfitireducens (nom. illeg.)]|uniref:sulfate reduction electron transfer complex DsrMKJOP subunit DsrJ n=1 Tax=Neomoorella sulfitireducens TaxID=2972948 RepID=UPI0021AC99B7
MNDFRYIITGLVLFIVLVTFPLWTRAGKAAPAPVPSLETQAIQQLEEKQCVEGTEYMRANHMSLLEEWRNQVVREGKRTYVAGNGKEYEMSLQKTCLQCHSNKSQFCDQCHNYLGVQPDCWTCHIEPKES